MGTPDGLNHIKRIATLTQEPVVIVVSALSKITDTLIELADATANSRDTSKMIDAILTRHRKAITDSVPENNQQNCLDKILPIIENLKREVATYNTTSPTQERLSQLHQNIVCYGELLSSVIVHNIFDHNAFTTKHIDSREIIKTSKYFDRHIINFSQTNKLIQNNIPNQGITVMGGFISSDAETKQTTNLGRGGSDYTAAIVAAAIGASQLEIYTDVDGFLTADPRVVEKSTLIEKIDYCETMELCNFGAKVVYAPTILPAYLNNIPTYIRNTYNPNCNGTLIHNCDPCDTPTPQSITAVAPISLIEIKGRTTGLNYKIFRLLASKGIENYFARGDEHTTLIAVTEKNCQAAIAQLNTELQEHLTSQRIQNIVVHKNLATIAIIGNNIGSSNCVQAAIFDALKNVNINVNRKRISLGVNSISIVVPIECTRPAISTIHQALFESEKSCAKTPSANETFGCHIAIEVLRKMVAAGDVIRSVSAYFPEKTEQRAAILANHLGVEIDNTQPDNCLVEFEITDGVGRFRVIEDITTTPYDSNGTILIYSARYREYPLHINL